MHGTRGLRAALTSIIQPRDNDATACARRKEESGFDNREYGEAFGILKDGPRYDAVKSVIAVVHK